MFSVFVYAFIVLMFAGLIVAAVKNAKGKRRGLVWQVLDALAQKGKDAARGPRFVPKKVLTAPEQTLYHRLKAALPYEVLAQVAFSQFIGVKGGSRKANFAKFGTARQKVADFVICRRDLSILAVVELDDRSHTRKRDQAKNAVLEEAGIPIIRWHVKDMPDRERIRDAVAALVQPQPEASQNVGRAEPAVE
ncbi:DUF2726 domain-containing protein [Arhodomonas sp. AD133]|uniref:DUF2726 domain-containing protein n=1 Tax=Arhodomonas sp. AD133 TaxID=3415009 RepID=UPI003EB94245